MADPRRVRLTHEERFPVGAFAVAVEAVQEFDAEKGRTGVQARDKDSGLPLWVVNVFDPEARSREVRVRIAASAEPVLPPVVAVPGVLEGLRPVAFHNLLGTPYVNTQGRRAALAWSYRADSMTAPAVAPVAAAAEHTGSAGVPAASSAAGSSGAGSSGESGRRGSSGGGSR
jgi:hypothetical protein